MISIIVPVYNVENYIIECLTSIKNQTYNDYEVIIVDDGSPDKSAELIEEFLISEKDNRFKLYHKENGGLSDARNYGVQFAKGEYIIFMDSDDFWDSNILLSISNEINENKGIDIIRIPMRMVDEVGNEISKNCVNEFHKLSGDKALILLRKNRITFETAWSYAIKLSYWKENNYSFAKGRYHEDLGLMPRVIVSAKSVSSLSLDSYYNYRQRANSIIRTQSKEMDLKKAKDRWYFYKTEKDYINKINCSKLTKKIYLQYYADAALTVFHSFDKDQRKEMLKTIEEERILKDYPIYSFKCLIKYIYHSITIYKLKRGINV